MVSFKDGGYTRGVFRTNEEAHAWFIEQGSESPWEWVPVSATLDQTDAIGRVLDTSSFGTIDALKKRIAELESERDSWKRAAEYASEKIDKARAIFS